MQSSQRCSRSARLGSRVITIGFTLAIALGACSSDEPLPSPADSSTLPSATTDDPTFTIVAIGDSETTGAGDPTGEGWVGRYASLIEDEYGINVAVENHAVEGQYSAELLQEIESDEDLRQQLAGTDVVLIGTGGADLNIGDDALSAGTCEGKTCYVPVVREFARNFEEIVSEVASLQGSGGVMRALASPNAVPGAEDIVPSFITHEIGLYQATALRDAICATMEDHDGQ